MRFTAPGSAEAANRFVASGLALAFWLTAQAPGHAQRTPAGVQGGQYGNAVYSNTPLFQFLGPWMRNAHLSEDPILKTEGMWPRADPAPTVVRELAESLSDRLGVLLVQAEREWVYLLNGRGEIRTLKIDGRPQAERGGRKAHVRLVDNTFEIETRFSGWLWTETFRRHGVQLVRTTHLQSGAVQDLQFRTVYDPVGSEHPSATPAADQAFPVEWEPVRIVPPVGKHGELLTGRVEVHALAVEAEVAAVEFFLDGSSMRRVRKPPFKTRIELADPPREHTLEVRAYGPSIGYLGKDEIPLNRVDRPFAVHITGIRAEPSDRNSAVRVEAVVSLPRSTTLERVDFYRSAIPAATVDNFRGGGDPSAARTVQAEGLIEEAAADDFVRVTARLADGRETEDAELLQGSDYQSEIDVQLVQFQVLVTDRDGSPVSGLSPTDFEIRENGRKLQVEDLHTAHDVPLVLGLAIDSSDSMLPVWLHLRHIAERFLEETMAPDDRAFLVDFDRRVRLLQPLTGQQSLLRNALDRLTPMGGTAIHDGVLFSLLQYRREPGRRALVVVTDGADLHSRSRTDLATDFAERLGLPIYFVALDNSATGTASRAAGVRTVTSDLPRQKALKRLRRISQHTGGRLFAIELFAGSSWTERIEEVFDMIESDLRHQHVLTYYSQQPLGTPVEPEIRVPRRGLKLRSAVPLEAIE